MALWNRPYENLVLLYQLNCFVIITLANFDKVCTSFQISSENDRILPPSFSNFFTSLPNAS
jgi:hypothetical protein